jgi:hypothetical protein
MKPTRYEIRRKGDVIEVFAVYKNFFNTVTLYLHDNGTVWCNLDQYREDGTEHPVYACLLRLAKDFQEKEGGVK